MRGSHQKYRITLVQLGYAGSAYRLAVELRWRYSERMSLQSRILVTSQDSYELWLVASVQGTAADLPSEETELKAYMARRNCPLGMLVTPERAHFYLNNYTDYTPKSVELIAECPTIDLLEAPEKVVEPYLEHFVQEWLESLAGGARWVWPPAVREAIEFDVIPMITGGYLCFCRNELGI